MTYTELCAKYQSIIALRQSFESKLHKETPGSDRGRELYNSLCRVESAERAARRAVKAHPDAPPEG